MRRIIFMPLKVELMEYDIKRGMSDAAHGILTIKDDKHSELVAISKDKTDVTFEQPFDLSTVKIECKLYMYDRQKDRYFTVYSNKPKINNEGMAIMYCQESGPSVSFHILNV